MLKEYSNLSKILEKWAKKPNPRNQNKDWGPGTKAYLLFMMGKFLEVSKTLQSLGIFAKFSIVRPNIIGSNVP